MTPPFASGRRGDDGAPGVSCAGPAARTGTSRRALGPVRGCRYAFIFTTYTEHARGAPPSRPRFPSGSGNWGSAPGTHHDQVHRFLLGVLHDRTRSGRRVSLLQITFTRRGGFGGSLLMTSPPGPRILRSSPAPARTQFELLDGRSHRNQQSARPCFHESIAIAMRLVGVLRSVVGTSIS